jgi:dTDP-glucose pyrophosphorylase
VNGDQYVSEDVSQIIADFQKLGADGGIITFNSIHPKWSYALLDEDQQSVIETSEKRPISNNACVGMYYFKHGRLFIEAAKKVIQKGIMTNDLFFVSSTYNELILANQLVVAKKIDNSKFFALDSEENINYFFAKLYQLPIKYN